MTGTPISADEIYREVQKILANPAFARSRRLSQFLKFTVDLTLEGRASEIKEHRIGAEVFERGIAFDPQVDTIVRTQAHRLRAALSTYYENEGRQDPVVIEFAKGSYVPSIRENGASVVPAEPETKPTPPAVEIAGAAGAAEISRGWVLAWIGFALVAGVLIGAVGMKWQGAVPAAAHLPTHVLLPLFAQGTLNSSMGAVSLSPSGASVVFPLNEDSGGKRLWLRALRSMNAIGLAGTEGASHPFWSPTESEVGFFANGRLKVFRLSDGAIRDLCEAPLGRGGSWNRTGVILFTPQAANGRVYRVDAAGGTPEPVTSLDAGRGEIDHRWPEFLKDGRHFIYTSHSRSAPNSGIYLATIDGGAPVLLERTLSQAHYADTPDGDYLLYVKDKSIRSRRLNADAGRLEGVEVTLVHGAVYTPATGASFTIAHDQYLAYDSARNRESTLVQLDRSGRQLREVAAKANFEALTLTRDGRRLAAEIAQTDQDESDIWTSATDKSGFLRVTVDGGAQAVWGENGRSLYFVSPADGFLTIFQRAIGENENPVTLWKWRNSMFPTDLSPDGRYLALHVNNPNTQMDLYLLPLDPVTGRATGEPIAVRRSRFNERLGYFSPDGGHIAYVSEETGQPEIYVEELPDGKIGQGKRWKCSTAGGSHPRWRQDGRELYYLSPRRNLMRVDVRSVADGLEFSSPQTLMNSVNHSAGENKSAYAVSPDGESFYFLNAIGAGQSQVSVLTAWTSLVSDREK